MGLGCGVMCAGVVGILVFSMFGTSEPIFRGNMDEFFSCYSACSPTSWLLKLNDLLCFTSGACEGSLACSTCHVIVMVHYWPYTCKANVPSNIFKNMFL